MKKNFFFSSINEWILKKRKERITDDEVIEYVKNNKVLYLSIELGLYLTNVRIRKNNSDNPFEIIDSIINKIKYVFEQFFSEYDFTVKTVGKNYKKFLKDGFLESIIIENNDEEQFDYPNKYYGYKLVMESIENYIYRVAEINEDGIFSYVGFSVTDIEITFKIPAMKELVKPFFDEDVSVNNMNIVYKLKYSNNFSFFQKIYFFQSGLKKWKKII